MASNIVSSFKAFTESFKVPDEKDARVEALKKYFARGGVVSAVKKSGSVWPNLIYPSPLRVKSQLKELQDLKDYFAKKRSEWDKRLKDAKSYPSRCTGSTLRKPSRIQIIEVILRRLNCRCTSSLT